MGIENNNAGWSVLLKFKIGLKLRCCAKLSVLYEESNGDGEDARRPLNNIQKPSTTLRNLQSHIH
eukprot:14588049-Heterocapsa_arctica.AAC.1